MFAEERYRRILELVNAAGKATVSQLSEELNVSAVTVRRDLEKLEEMNLLVRTHGGAIPVGSDVIRTAAEKPFSEKAEALTEEKRRIAAAAAALVEDDDAVLLAPGTTSMLIAKELAVSQKRLTLVTNAVNIALYLSSNSEIEVMLLGGSVRRKSLAAVGPVAEEALARVRVDKLFLGVDGFDLQEGLTTPNVAEASINRKMMSIARETIVVADHSKFGKVLFAHIAPIEQVDKVISDRGLNRELAKKIRDLGISLTLV